jgi:hypothetical protein
MPFIFAHLNLFVLFLFGKLSSLSILITDDEFESTLGSLVMLFYRYYVGSQSRYRLPGAQERRE